MKKLILALACLTLCVTRSEALVNVDNVDPEYNTTSPLGNTSWCGQVKLTNTTTGAQLGGATILEGGKWILGATHTTLQPGSGAAILNGESYPIIARTNAPDGAHTMWKTSGTFPTNSRAKRYRGAITNNMPMLVFGYSAPAGNEVYKQYIATNTAVQLLLSNVVQRDQMFEFDVMCTNAGTLHTFVLQQSTNMTDWVNTATQCTVRVSVPCDNSPKMFYRAMSVPSITTNSVLIGWELGTEYDCRLRWGSNIVFEVGEGYFYSRFNRHGSCMTTPLDSGNGCDVLDPADMEWKFAGVNQQSEYGAYSNDGCQTWWNGTIFDRTGLALADFNHSTGEFDKVLDMIPEGWGPAKSMYTPIPNEWIDSVIGQ